MILRSPQALDLAPVVQPIAVEGQFGWLHLAEHAPRRRAGFVICTPPGRDDRCSHRHMRTLAQSLAGLGFPVMRIDPLGVGESLDLGETDEAWGLWRTGAAQAVAFLKAQTGIDQVIMCGLRMGARLAADIPADGLVLLAPVATGKTWLRELKLAASLSRTAGPDDQDSRESEGLYLNAATVQGLQSVDLAGLPGGASHALVFAQNAQARSIADRLAELGAATEVHAFPGYEDLLDDSHSSKAPLEVFDTLLTWADTTYGDLQASPIQPKFAPVVLKQEGFQETPVDLGLGSNGMVTRPAAASGLGLIFCNTSCEPRSGIGRFAVSTARTLAVEGVTSLRFDFLGVGDSDGEGEGHMYTADRQAEFLRASDYLRSQGCTTIAVVAVCSGAFHTIRAMGALPAIEQGYCVSSKLVWREGESLDPQFRDQGKATASYAAGVRNPETWKRLLKGDIDLIAVGRTLSGRLLTKLKARLDQSAGAPLISAVNAIAARGGGLRLVMGVEDSSLDELETYFGAQAKRLTKLPGMSMRVIEDLDHGLAKSASRQIILEDLRAFLKLS